MVNINETIESFCDVSLEGKTDQELGPRSLGNAFSAFTFCTTLGHKREILNKYCTPFIKGDDVCFPSSGSLPAEGSGRDCGHRAMVSVVSVLVP